MNIGAIFLARVRFLHSWVSCKTISCKYLARQSAQECRNRTLAGGVWPHMGIKYRKNILVNSESRFGNTDIGFQSHIGAIFLARVPFLQSWAADIACLISFVSCLMSLISCLTSHISCLTSHIHDMSHTSHRMPHTCEISHISHLMSHRTKRFVGIQRMSNPSTQALQTSGYPPRLTQ